MVAKLYYIDAAGNRTDMKASFENGTVSFNTNHFSTYAVVFEESPANLTWLCIALLALVLLVIYRLIIRKRRRAK